LPQQDQSGFSGASPQPSSTDQDIHRYVRQLEEAIQQKQLQKFYPPGDYRIQETAGHAAEQIETLVTAWNVPKEIAVDMVR
jgi:hypothetical protein